MFSKFAIALLTLATTLSSTVATPVSLNARSDFSLSGWNGHQGLSGFDDFYGSDNFDGSRNEPIFIEQDRLVCSVVPVHIIQQRLVVLQEIAKKVILEHVCEVETQVIVFNQFHNSFGNFRYDIDRRSGRRNIGYDRDIVSHYDKFFQDDGKVSFDDFGFKGRDVGKNSVFVDGFNWDDSKSSDSVRLAFEASESSRKGTSKFVDF